MKSINHIILSILVITSVLSCKQQQTEIPAKKASLKTAFADDFYMGVAINRGQILERDSIETALIEDQFNSISPENVMKSMFIHPARDTFNFDFSDKYVAFGKKNNMFIHGHTLIWHSQLAPWFKAITDSTDMAHAVEDHINTIVGRYKGEIGSWDVVNEALNEDGTLRKSVFLDVLGPDYLALAFKTASEADPDVDLYYNDYNMTNPEKRAGAIRLIKNIQKQGVKIDGIGMQGHWNLKTPTLDQIEESIESYAALGIKVAITELDITVLPNPWDLQGAEVSQRFENNEKMNPYPDKLPDSVQVQLAERYKSIFKLFLKHRKDISRVTLWGLTDKNSWLNGWPIPGRTNYPLLFNREYQPKAAFDSIMALKTTTK